MDEIQVKNIVIFRNKELYDNDPSSYLEITKNLVWLQYKNGRLYFSKQGKIDLTFERGKLSFIYDGDWEDDKGYKIAHYVFDITFQTTEDYNKVFQFARTNGW